MMYRWTLLLVLCAVPAGGFVACGEEGDTTVTEEAQTPSEETTTTTTTAKRKATGGGGGGTSDSKPTDPSEAERGSRTVPDVVQERLDVGNKELKAAGYKTSFVGGDAFGGVELRAFGVVELRKLVICDQKPSGGSSAPPGTKVDLTVDRSC